MFVFSHNWTKLANAWKRKKHLSRVTAPQTVDENEIYATRMASETSELCIRNNFYNVSGAFLIGR